MVLELKPGGVSIVMVVEWVCLGLVCVSVSVRVCVVMMVQWICWSMVCVSDRDVGVGSGLWFVGLSCSGVGVLFVGGFVVVWV